MSYFVTSTKSFEASIESIAAACAANKFGILHSFDPYETLKTKGIELAHKNIRIFEVCSPPKAKLVLETNLAFSCVLPCKISLWEEPSGEVRIGTILPSTVLASAADTSSIADAVVELDNFLRKILDEAK
jgi:uncharacterized protein (DUF302 family)